MGSDPSDSRLGVLTSLGRRLPDASSTEEAAHEVVRALATSEETFQKVFRFAQSLGKEPIACRDNSGFVVNRLLVPYLLDAIRGFEEGIGSMDDIDKGMRFGCAHPMGPFELADLIGLDTCLAISEVLHAELGDDKYRPAPLLRQYVAAGWLGRKAGRGFYKH